MITARHGGLTRGVMPVVLTALTALSACAGLDGYHVPGPYLDRSQGAESVPPDLLIRPVGYQPIVYGKAYGFAGHVHFFSIEQSGDRRRAWILRNYSQPQESDQGVYLSRVAQFEYDCAAREYAFIEGTTYSAHGAQGAAVFELYPDPELWQAKIAPGSVAEYEWRAVCAR